MKKGKKAVKESKAAHVKRHAATHDTIARLAQRAGRASLRKLPQLTNTPFVNAEQEFQLWQQGKSVSSIAKQYGYTRGVSETFILLAGSKEAYQALRAKGGGGRAFGGGGKGTGKTRVARVQEDKKVKRVVSSPRWKIDLMWEPIVVKIKTGDKDGSEKKMSWRTVRAKVYVAPSGNRYVEAAHNERADLVLVVKLRSMEHAQAKQALAWAEADAARNDKTLGPKKRARLESAVTDTHLPTMGEWTIRLRRFESSAIARKIHKDEHLATRGLKAQEAKRKQKEQQEREIARHARDRKKQERELTKPVRRVKKIKKVKR